MQSGTIAAPPLHPVRVASVDLCTDELALLLAFPGQLVSISRRGTDPFENPIDTRPRGLKPNRPRVADIAAIAPDLIVASAADAGGVAVARQLGIAVVNVVPPRSIAEMHANVRQVARALGRGAAGEALIARMNIDLGRPAPQPQTAVMIGEDGRAVAARGLAAEWLRYAGLAAQPVAGGRMDMSALLAAPPAVLVVPRYRPGRTRPPGWRIADLRGVRRIETDGRAWTCAGPPLATEIARLRRLAARVEP